MGLDCFGTAVQSNPEAGYPEGKALLTSPVPALLVEMAEIPLTIKQAKLVMQYVVKPGAHRGKNPTKVVLMHGSGSEGKERQLVFVFNITETETKQKLAWTKMIVPVIF